VLAGRNEFLRPDAAERVEATLRERRAIPLSRFDQVQVIGAGELDRLCAAAVRRLRSYTKGQVALLDVLGHMDPDRICAVYFALPEAARKYLHRDGAWDYHVRRVEAEMPEAIAEIESLAHESEQFAKRRAELVAEMSAADEAAWARFEREQLEQRAGVVPTDADVEAAKAEARELLRRGKARAEELLSQ
jgi:hypothetical protein